ncbi:uncharacterized protein LOC114785243 isoform X1 [Denticeps clupeoides]|nr:uncharacterized protein LOC114785243 isoform X1 [Denticeps clupeoides]
MLNRQKERGKLRTLFHRSLSMNDLLHERDLSGRDCADPSDQPMRAKEGDEEHSSLKHPSSQFISHTFPSHMFTSSVRIRPWGEGKDCHKDGVDSIQGHTDGQSESSGAFSLENEAWSSGSSPTQEPPRSRCSESAAPPKPPRDALALASYSSGRGIWRSSSGRATGSKGVQSQNLRRTESARVTRVTKGSCSHSTSRPGDKSSSASSCLDCFSTPLRRGGHGSRGGNGPCSTLPRSSSVISTSEGSSRRASFHSMISRSATASPRKNNIDESRDKESDQIPSPSAHQSASELEAPGLTERPDGADVRCPEPPFRPLFTIDSVFSNTIFGEPSLKSQVQTSFSLDSSHDHKISGVQVKKQAEPVSLDKQENQKSGEQDFSVNESVTSVYHSLSDLSSTKAENEMN